MIGTRSERAIKEIPKTKNMEISGLIMHVAITPIIEVCPSIIAMSGVVAKVAPKDALILEHKKSGKNGERK